ncbi:MAG: RNA methyltransferase [Woeseiaceae bacterium]|nr:RNA methyltransferase [Woeseiaceae bacterium]
MSIRIVLVGTTHPGNIGAVARAMKNMDLNDLILVNPKCFPHEDATARASGASDVLDAASVVTTLSKALIDCVYVVGASARDRAINWPSMQPRDCAERMILESKKGKIAAVFGPEKTGLHNDDLDLCHALLTIPTNQNFRSLNLAMAVQILTYELRVASSLGGNPGFKSEASPATGDEMEHFYDHLEQTMIDLEFLDLDNPRFLMRRLRRMFIRARPDKNEINILRGFLTAIDRKKGSS